MPKLRYAIADLFFAASVGCLALWWASVSRLFQLRSPIPISSQLITWQARDGYLRIMHQDAPNAPWEFLTHPVQGFEATAYPPHAKAFRREWQGFRTPLWFPTLVFPSDTLRSPSM